jgi:ubiquinone/menaquinone biosynthesis C-methylase UbiE
VFHLEGAEQKGVVVTSTESPVYGRFAEIYDEAYHFVDYQRSAAWVRDMIRRYHSRAGSLLEVACGTGRYLELLAGDFTVEGLDLSPEMLRRAHARLPAVPLHRGDMANFSLGRRYDVVCCLFRSIAYLGTAERLHAAVATMARHLAPGGLLLIEPFFTPETYWVNRVTLNEYKRDDLAIAWMYVSERTTDGARLRTHTLVGTPAGVEHFVEVHDLGLFRREDFVAAFQAAGLALEYDSVGPAGMGMYIGRIA